MWRGPATVECQTSLSVRVIVSQNHCCAVRTATSIEYLNDAIRPPIAWGHFDYDLNSTVRLARSSTDSENTSGRE
jgi:DNA-binding transcriptional regulator YdaS (Cro superfamily)